jgi:hypothetical protein
MIELKYSNGIGFARLSDATIDRISLEAGGNIARLTFSDKEKNFIQVDLVRPEFWKLRERANKRTDI